MNQATASVIATSWLNLQFANSATQKIELRKNSTIRPATDSDVAFLSLTDQAHLIRTKKISSVELVEIYFQRIQNINSNLKLNCFINLNKDGALKRSKELDKLAAKNKWTGPLHGTLISIKDDLEVVDLPMTTGSELMQNWKPTKDAFCIAKLKNDGAIISGKTNLDEFTFGALGQNLFFGQVKNPYNLNYSPGGSSSGSAVSVAAGFSSASIGSDAAGSVRVPAASCGVYGFKPTLGLISKSGLTPFIPTKDTVGCMARSALDIKTIINSIRGFDINDELTHRVPQNIDSYKNTIFPMKLKIGFAPNILDPMAIESIAVFTKGVDTLKSLKFQIQEINIQQLRQIYEIGRTINFVEQRTWIEILLKKTRPNQSFENLIKETQLHIQKRLKIADEISSVLYCTALLYKKNEINEAIKHIFETVDFIVMPTLGGSPPLIDGLKSKSNTQSREIELYKFPCELAGLLGLPSITIPQAIGTNGLPIGFQIIAKPYKDDQLIELAIFLENKLGQFTRPNL